jgi:hypothetical protein
MQTFVPIATDDYKEIAKTLDNKRLNKQALEGWQILMNLLELDPQGEFRRARGWRNHPAVKMWAGHETELYTYIIAMTDEWVARGHKTTIGEKATQTLKVAYQNALVYAESKPDWMTDQAKYEQIASSHRRALLVKDYAWYSQFNWPEDTGQEPVEYEYVWPTNERKETNVS